jgi:RecA-family ATPase
VHDDQNPSLSISFRDGKLLCRCHAGCSQDEVFEEVRRRAGHLVNGSLGRDGGRRETVYTYNDASGKPIARVIRTDLSDGTKAFKQQTPDGESGWQWKGPRGAKPLYRLDALARNANATVVICEGEKAAEAAQRQLGERFVATSWMGGAQAAAHADLSPLEGRDVIVWPDNDAPGAHAAKELIARLRPIARGIWLAGVGDLPAKADAADVNWTPDQFLARLDAAAVEANESPRENVASVVSETSSAGDLPALVDLHHLASTEPMRPPFIIDGWLPEGEVTLLAGHGGTGKSQIALMLATCVAAGKPFLGMPTQRRRSAFLSLEDGRRVLHWRLSRICSWLGVNLVQLAGELILWDGSAASEPLASEERDKLELTHVYEWLRAQIAGEGVQLLVIDGASDAFDADENRRAQVRKFIMSLRRLVPTNGAVVLLGHVNAQTSRNPETSQGYSGSTAWNNSVRARWYLREEAGEDQSLLLEVQKSNLSASGHSVRLRWNDEAHVHVGELSMPGTKLERRLTEADEREVLLRLIKEAPEPIPASTSGPRTSWHVLSVHPDFPASLRGKDGRKRTFAHIETMRGSSAVRAETMKYGRGNTKEVLR